MRNSFLPGAPCTTNFVCGIPAYGPVMNYAPPPNRGNQGGHLKVHKFSFLSILLTF